VASSKDGATKKPMMTTGENLFPRKSQLLRDEDRNSENLSRGRQGGSPNKIEVSNLFPVTLLKPFLTSNG
jgi:hypothetical protein